MQKPIDSDDPVKSLIELDPKSGKFEPTEDGYIKFIPSDEELEALNLKFGEEIAQAISDHDGFFEQIRKNWETYRARPEAMRDGDVPVITLPIVGREIDQMVAYETVTVMRPRTVVSFDPYFKATYETPALVDDPQMLGAMGLPPEMGPVPMPVEKDAEEVANAWAMGFDFKLRERLDGRRLFKTIFKDIHVVGYSVVKNVYERRYRTVGGSQYAKAPEGWLTVVGEREWEVLDGEPNQFLPVSQFSFLMPMDENDVQTSPWVSEDVPEDPTTFREKLDKEYTLLDPKDWDAAIASTTDSYRQTADKALRENVDRRMAGKPSRRHDIKEVWFHHPVKVKEQGEDGKEVTRFRVMSFCGEYHYGLRKFLCIYRNPYRHGKRPYVVFFEDEETHRHASGSTVERVAKHQKLISQGLHLDFQNVVQANNFNYFVNPNSESWAPLTQEANYPGKVIPRLDPNDVEMKQAGTNHPGLSNIVSFLIGDLSKTTGQNEYKMGNVVPNRTAASTVAQIMEAAYVKPVMTMQAVSDCFAKLVRMWLETERQFNPFGEVLPTRDPETKELIEIAFRFPTEPVFDNFRIALTAADEELAKETDIAETIMLANEMAASNERIVGIAGAMADLNATPALTAIFESALETENEFRRMLLRRKRTDLSKFVIPKEKVQALLAEKERALILQQQQMAMEQAAMGGQGGNQGVPAPAGAPAGGVGEMAGAPVDAGSAPVPVA